MLECKVDSRMGGHTLTKICVDAFDVICIGQAVDGKPVLVLRSGFVFRVLDREYDELCVWRHKAMFERVDIVDDDDDDTDFDDFLNTNLGEPW